MLNKISTLTTTCSGRLKYAHGNLSTGVSANLYVRAPLLVADREVDVGVGYSVGQAQVPGARGTVRDLLHSTQRNELPYYKGRESDI